jgi:uncharacterized protein YciI
MLDGRIDAARLLLASPLHTACLAQRELAMRTTSRALSLLLLVASAAQAAAPPAPNMEKYYLVLLKRTAHPPQLEQAALESLQEKHIGHLHAMFEAGKLAVAGPFDEQQPADVALRGMCLYRTATAAEARKLAEDDPMVKSGRLEVDVLAWWVEKGYVTFKQPAAK